jgi:hypothetical protein
VGRQLIRFFSCSNPSETRLFREHLLCVHSAVEGCASFFFLSISAFLGAISDSLATRCLGAAGRGAERLEREDFFGGKAAAFGSVWGFWRFLAKCRLKAQSFPTVVVGLNNQQGGEKLLFRSSRVIFWEYSEVERSFGGLFGLSIRLIIFSGLIRPKKGVFRIHDLMSIICIIILVISQVVIF